jgi:arylformamidase
MSSFDSWRALSPVELEREYSPSSCIGGDYQPFIRAYTESSRVAVEITSAAGCEWSSHQYGDGVTQFIQLCSPPGPSRPLVVFLHGGYWQELSSADSLFLAPNCVEHGYAFVAVNYTLAPAASVDQIVDECVEAIVYLVKNAANLRIDPTRIVLSGSSAGAHLAAMTTIGLRAYEIEIAELVLISGVFWLEPLIGTSINSALGLDGESAYRNSPGLVGLLELGGGPPTRLIVGEIETEQFKLQSKVFTQWLKDCGVSVSYTEIEGRNHFDVAMCDLFD